MFGGNNPRARICDVLSTKRFSSTSEGRPPPVVRLSLTPPPKFSIKSLRSVAFLGGFRLPLGPRGNLPYSPPFCPINFVDLVLFFSSNETLDFA
jgi:hypothetical protein